MQKGNTDTKEKRGVGGLKPIETKELSVNEIRPSAVNPRVDLKPGDPEYENIKRSISEFGLVDPLVWNKHNRRLVGGNQRFKVLKELGWKRIPVSVVDIKDPAKEKALNIALNKIQGDWEAGMLAKILNDLTLSDFNMDLTGFDGKEIQSILDEMKAKAEPTPETIPTPPKKPTTKAGDLWALGNHLLFCGDATNHGRFPKRFKKEKSNLTFTSPPYWVGMEYETQKSIKEIDQFIVDVSNSIIDVMKTDNARIIINTGVCQARLFTKKTETLFLVDRWINAFRKYDWLMRHLRLWVKSGGLAGPISARADVIDQHCEFIATLYNTEGKQRGMNKLLKAPWVQQGYIDDLAGDASAGGVHCAAFPVELPRRFICLYTNPGEIVFDPFGGSGTTLIAAEKMGRRCHAVELYPGYCDVIIERFENHSGKKAKKIK